MTKNKNIKLHPDVKDPELGESDKIAEDATAEGKKNDVSPPSLSRFFLTFKAEQPMLLVGLLLLLIGEATTQVIPLIVAKAYTPLSTLTLTRLIKWMMSIGICFFQS
mmetsp:Transcript_42193/g.82794  ORF Transcript_42193/g.82794 Transcript_42193/m.82794 type:complete len:107 (+) Transcript_42193:175-495(+)